jgi:hypothetical protein
MSDAVAALFIAPRLASRTLELTAGSTAHLPVLFPQVEGIRRLNRNIEDAQKLFTATERYLSYMAIPFVLSVHGTLVVNAIRMIRTSGVDNAKREQALIPLERLHEEFQSASSVELPGIYLELFHFARELRNRLVHFGAVAGSHLRECYDGMSVEARREWCRLGKRPFVVQGSKDEVSLNGDDVRAVMAISRSSVRSHRRVLGLRDNRQIPNHRRAMAAPLSAE